LNDELQPLKNRLRWLNRGILLLGVLILIGLAVWAAVGLRKPAVGTTTTVISPAARPSAPAPLASASAAAHAASTPRQAPSAAQVQKAAAAAIDALAAAGSAPQAAAQAAPAAAAASHPAPAQTAQPATPASPAAPAHMPVQQVQPPASQTSARPAHPQHAAAPHKPPRQRAPRQAAAAQGAAAHGAVAARHPVGAVAVCRRAGWYVQVGAFGKPQGIERLAQRLHRAGYTEVCLAAQTVRGLRLFYVGPFRSAAAARAARAPLHRLTGAEGILRKLP
jgi:hypothetical protein